MATAVTRVEVDILKRFTSDLTNLISGEIAKVASKLVEANLISDDLLDGEGRRRERANEMISQVINRVKSHPEDLNTFLDKLNEISTLQKIAKEIREAYANENGGISTANQLSLEQRLKELERSIDAKNEVITTLRRDLGSVKNSHARLEEIDTEMGENLLEPAEAEVEKCEEESKEKADTKLAFPQSDDKPDPVVTTEYETCSPTAALLSDSCSSNHEETEMELSDCNNQASAFDTQVKNILGLVKKECKNNLILYTSVPLAFFVVFVIPFIILLGVSFDPCSAQSFFTLYPNVVFVSRFDTLCGNTVQFNKTNGGTVTFYPAPCSAIPTRRVHNTYTRELFTAGGEDIQQVYFARGGDPGYRLREIYLVDGSVITYTFTSTSTVNVACMAIVYVFQNYSSYQEFRFQEAAESYCVPPNFESVTFTLSADGKDQYYYLGIRTGPYLTMNYTVTEDILQYDVTNLTAITCSLPLPPVSTDCSISLSDYTTPNNTAIHSPERYVCILATAYSNDSVNVIFETPFSEVLGVHG